MQKSASVQSVPFRGGGFAPRPVRGMAIAVFVILLVLAEIGTRTGFITSLTLPRPTAVLETLVQLWQTGGLWNHLIPSLQRLLIGAALGISVGISLGVLIGLFSYVRAGLVPLVAALFPIPKIALLPLFVIWFGIDETSKVLLIFLACFAPLAMSAQAGVRSVTIEQINAAYSMGASPWQVVRHVVIPAALPDILTGMRIAIGFGWTTLVAAEMVAANTGLGQMVLNASNFLRTDIVIMGIVVIGVVAYGFDLLMRWIERKLVPWKGRM